MIRYAEDDGDVIAIHQFLIEVATPVLRCPIDHSKSAREVWRVCNENVGIMALVDGVLVGTMGLIDPEWWYGHGRFMTDRWHFVHPDHHNGPVNAALFDEARKIAAAAGLDFIHQGKIRGEKSGVLRMMPRAYAPESA